MSRFRYEGRDDLGNMQSGVVEAATLGDANARARECVRWVTRIDPIESDTVDARPPCGLSLAAILASVGISATRTGIPVVGFGGLAWLLEQFQSV